MLCAVAKVLRRNLKFISSNEAEVFQKKVLLTQSAVFGKEVKDQIFIAYSKF